MDPCSPCVGVQGEVPPLGKGAYPPRHPKHPVEERPARRYGSRSMEERIWLRSSGQRRSSPHVFLSNVPNRHGLNPSILRTTRRGNAIVEPIPDGMRSCEHPRPNLPVRHRRRKSPGHYGKTPGPIASGHPNGGAPRPAPDDARCLENSLRPTSA